MFGFEVAARREQERRAKESDPVQQFLEQKRERKHPHLVFVSDETAHRQEEPRQEQSLETELVGFRLVKPLTCAAEVRVVVCCCCLLLFWWRSLRKNRT
jgi:hypothetical protein